MEQATAQEVGNIDAEDRDRLAETVGRYELLNMADGSLVQTHGPDVCFGPNCCIHNPSEHHMRDMPLLWVGDNIKMMYRRCEHDAIHPDPDSFDFRRIMHLAGIMGMVPDWHPCCGQLCCNAAKYARHHAN